MSEWDDKAAEWYAQRYGEYATNSLAIDALEELSPSVVLDVGCGTGSALRHASLRWPRARLIGVDPVARMVEIAQERLAGHPRAGSIDIKVGAAEELPMADASVNLVLAFDSLDHWNDAATGAREVYRVLALGGRLVVVKDQSVPGGSNQVVKVFSRKNGWKLERNQQIHDNGISFAMWVFTTEREQV